MSKIWKSDNVKREVKMLPYCKRFCVSMLIILEICQVSTSYKSIILPNSEQIIINEGETLRISCKDYPMKFVYPDNPEINTSYYFIHKYMENNSRIFERPKTVFSDTGWYGCSNHNEIITNFYDPQMTWLYVYVKSNRSAFVEANTNAHLNAAVGDNIVIPCRTTSPCLQPILINDKGNEVNNAIYDPKFGFTIKNLSLDDNDSYKCLIKMNTKEYMVNYALSVHLNRTLTEPKIQIYNKYNKLVREPYVNCTAEMEIYMRYEVDRNTRRKDSGRRNTQQFEKHFDGYSILVKTLKLIEIENENTMAYECNILTNYDKKTITKEINITYHEMDTNYNTNFTFLMNTSYYQNVSGSIEWDFQVTDSRVNDSILWFRPNDEKIIQSWENFISFEYNEHTKLEKGHLKIIYFSIWDSGNYTLRLKYHNMTKNLNVKLDVVDKPISTLNAFDNYYSPNENKEFSCLITSNPPPNITWNFLKCPNYPSLENSTIVHLTNVTQSSSNILNTSYTLKSIVKMLINVSGKMTCEACNEIGCDSETKDFLVSDGLGAFGIIRPKESVITGENLELVCTASIYNYIDEITWTVYNNGIEQPLIETERLKIIKQNTSFTYRSTLKFYNVQKSDAKDYLCTGKILNASSHLALYFLPVNEIYKLVIHDPVPPYFIKTNMNKTKTRIIDMMTEGQNTTILQCHADGMPKPTVTWYKDKVLLNKSNQYLFKNNDQELHITYWMQHDSGKYLCRAVSRLGTIETYQQIAVKNTKWHTLDVVLFTSIPILGFILIISTIYFIIKIRREKSKRKELMEAGLLNFEEGALECLDPKLTIDEQAELLPYDKKWEFPRDRLNLTMREQLGSGNFGVVMKAEAIGICKNENVTTVAVKMVRRSTDPIYIRALVSELKIMAHLGKHLNVVNLLGACTNNVSKCELLMIVEYCRFGNLHNYLLRHRNDFINQINPKTKKHDFTIGMDILTRNVNVNNDNRINMRLSLSNSLNGNSNIDVMAPTCPKTNSDSPEMNFLPDCVSDNLSQPEWRSNHCNDPKDENTKPICTKDLLSWAFQVARGMEYLSQRNILHGDLAARNILLTEDSVVKICDFGFAKILYKESNYKKKIAIPMPIKWMAIESIRNRIFSTQSDVWSFGIMLWELFTLAETPYPSIDVTILHHKLIEGYRMEQPNYAIDEVYDIILQCWITKPTLRPSFTDLVESIGDLLEEDVKMHYVTLNNSYMDINMMNLKNEKDDYLMMTSVPDYEVLSSIYKCENSLSKETFDSTYLYMRSGCSLDESKIFNLRQHAYHSNIELLSHTSDSEEATDLSSMPKRRRSI